MSSVKASCLLVPYTEQQSFETWNDWLEYQLLILLT